MKLFKDLTDKFNRLTGGSDMRNDAGESRLYRAVRAGSRSEVRHLLKSGADPNLASKSGLTPLHEAAYWGEVEILGWLIEKKGDVNARDQNGMTPLHVAALSGGLRGRADIIALLKKHGADESAADRNGLTALQYMSLWEDNTPAAAKWRALMADKSGQGEPELRLLTLGRLASEGLGRKAAKAAKPPAGVPPKPAP